ncbi:hypothetical protein DKAM_0828 [Desulfurococcus amylolyticus 1221n]|uniref:Uncharacterized protein n=1 Tax=Desulfurococcus amylolyticus (strain DSM 18924 / JCM 16383 / VKM B-2413 / 1221n) TaxID=490899 RepID=B8D4X3_DESA1|nr:hypothetical protein [Desulfurococcus amylolyticus]ACL11154.1 hypothetical protein DKAM_0828 [Desulfurococcus amylolyticus 1221n]
MLRRLYMLGSIIVIMASYMVPYLILYNAKGLELLLFWVLLTITWIIVSIIYLRHV